MKLRIEKAIYGGAGLARNEGKAVFVPFALPGETVEARIAEDRGGYATAELEAVLEPSAARVKAACAYFGACGGCHYQHADYATQLEMKRAILRETLERARIREVPEMGVVSGEAFGYRNRVRLHVQRNPFCLCYKRRNSHVNLPVAACPIAAPWLEKAIEIVNREGARLGLGAWVTEAEFFSDREGSALLVAFWTERSARDAQRLLEEMWPGLQEALPQVAGAAVFSLGKKGQPGRMLASCGAGELRYACGGRAYRVSAGSFFQVNRFLIDALVDLVTGNESGASAWDLYAGVGLFSLALTEKFAEVTAVESAASSVRDLRENLRGTRHRIVASDTAAFLRRAVEERAPAPDLVVADPPRAGLGRDVTTFLGKLRAPRITYVSCDPATLGRDLAALLECGYRLNQVRLVDLFPQTYHMESVTHLTLD